MKQPVGVTDVGDLIEINREIHDQWFDLDRVIHDINRSELRLIVYPGRERTSWLLHSRRPPLNRNLPAPIGELVVRNVETVTIEDGAEVGWYDIDALTFDPETGRLPEGFPSFVFAGFTST